MEIICTKSTPTVTVSYTCFLSFLIFNLFEQVHPPFPNSGSALEALLPQDSTCRYDEVSRCLVGATLSLTPGGLIKGYDQGELVFCLQRRTIIETGRIRLILISRDFQTETLTSKVLLMHIKA